MGTSFGDYKIVRDGRIQHLAVTGVQKFNEAEDGCPLRWWYRYVEGKKEPERTWHNDGDRIQAQIDHYLLTGENVLGREAAAGKHLLPRPGADLLVDLGLNNEKRPPPEPSGRKVSWFPPEQSFLRAAGIPFIGFLDLVNPRGETVDEQGNTIVEPDVPECIDHKTAKNYKHSKTKQTLFDSTQMNGYAVFIAEVTGAESVRLSHNIYRTDPQLSADARKVTLIVSASQARERWRTVVEPIVERMKVVAATKREQDVKGNLSACESFGGCPHKPYCATYNSQSPMKRVSMGLLKGRQAAANGAAAPAVAAAPANGAGSNTPWIQQAGAAPQPPPQAYAPTPGAAQTFLPQAAPAPAQAPQSNVGPLPLGAMEAGHARQNEKYIVRGVLTMFLCSTGGKQSFIPLTNGAPSGTPFLIEPNEPIYAYAAPVEQPAPVVQHPVPIPQPQPVAAAVAPAPNIPPPPMVGAPAPGPAAPVVAAAPAAAAKPPRKARAQAQAAPATAPNPAGLVLFVNAVPNGPFNDLGSYVHEVVGEMQEQFQVGDIRVAPDNSPIGYAKWRGTLAQLVRAQPPPAGTYVAFTKGNEFTEVVVEALSPLCLPGALIRGV